MSSPRMKMVRKQVYIEPQQDAALKRRARELGVTESELIRRGIEMATFEAWIRTYDRKAWLETLEFVRERARHPLPEEPRTWTREELYDERPKAFSRRH